MVVPALHLQTRLRRLDYTMWLSRLCVCGTVPCRSQGKGDVQRKRDTSEAGANAMALSAKSLHVRCLEKCTRWGIQMETYPPCEFFFSLKTPTEGGTRQKSKTCSKTLTWTVAQFKMHPHLGNKLVTTAVMHLVKNELAELSCSLHRQTTRQM